MLSIFTYEKLLDLIINIFGVLIGGLLAFWIAKWQLSKQDKEANKKDIELIKFYIERMKIELRDNRNIVNQLIESLDYVSHSRDDIWDWAIAIVDSLSFSAYRDFLRTNLQKKMPVDVERTIFSSYEDLEGLMRMVKKSYYGHKFFLGFRGDQEAADLLLNNVKTYSRTVFDILKETVEVAYQYHENMKFKVS